MSKSFYILPPVTRNIKLIVTISSVLFGEGLRPKRDWEVARGQGPLPPHYHHPTPLNHYPLPNSHTITLK